MLYFFNIKLRIKGSNVAGAVIGTGAYGVTEQDACAHAVAMHTAHGFEILAVTPQVRS